MSTLGAYLAAAGFSVVDSPVMGRTTSWDRVRWITVHHTVSACSLADAPATAAYLKTAAGRYPPLCQLFLDQAGKVWTISQQHPGQAEPGRASHMGTGSYPGIPADRGNEVALGIECQCIGSHPLATHPVMYASLVRLVAALCRRYGLGADRVIGHKEYNPGKVDPRDSMATIRAAVATELARHGTTPSPTPPPTPTNLGIEERMSTVLARRPDTGGFFLIGPTGAYNCTQADADNLINAGWTVRSLAAHQVDSVAWLLAKVADPDLAPLTAKVDALTAKVDALAAPEVVVPKA